MKTCAKAGHVITLSLILLLLGFAAQPACAETIVVSGPVGSHGHATITNTITVSNLHDLPEGAYVTFNAPVYGSFADDGFSQTVSAQTHSASVTPVSATEMQETSGNLNIRYRQYQWLLNGTQGSTFTATVTTSFDYTVTANPQPRVFTDPYNSPGGVTAGADTLAEAVDMIANYVKLNDPGGCTARANLMLSQLQSAGIQGRVVQGVTVDTPLTTPQFAYNNAIHQLSVTWPRELHVWVQVYYPAEGVWVSYDPSFNKGFADQRHLAMGTSPATESALFRVNAYANGGVSLNLQTTIAFTGVTDTGSYTFRYLDPAPAGLSSTGFPMGREMTARPTVTPTPTPAPTATPTPTPGPSVTPTPTPLPAQNATATPTQTPQASVTPVPTQPPDDDSLNVTPGETQHYVTGTIVDAVTGLPLTGVTMLLDGQPVAIGPDGTFSIGAADGAHALTVSVPGYATINTNVIVSGGNLTEALKLSQIPAADSSRPDGRPCCGLPLAALVLLIIGLYRYGRA
ncbi:MAG: Transglutaminase-like superfamily protein [Methanocella sp. PtaU1.Bin125]|nr:MAG: Transglutaminase-like superfamily protein [Methanocella sp. PtaU1.Bin125]